MSNRSHEQALIAIVNIVTIIAIVVVLIAVPIASAHPSQDCGTSTQPSLPALVTAFMK